MDEFDKGVRLGASLYEIFCRAYNLDQKFAQKNVANKKTQPVTGHRDPVEDMDDAYQQSTHKAGDELDIERVETAANSLNGDGEQVYDSDTVNINLLNPFQCCMSPVLLPPHQLKPSPDKVTIASIIYLIRMDQISRMILNIYDVNDENAIIKQLYTLTNKLDHEPGKSRISFQEMVSVMGKYIVRGVEPPPEEKIDTKPWVDAAEHSLLGI